jgi:hypothetical protein
MIKTFELVRGLRLHTLQYYFNFIIFNGRLLFFEINDKIHNQTIYKNVHILKVVSGDIITAETGKIPISLILYKYLLTLLDSL